MKLKIFLFYYIYLINAVFMEIYIDEPEDDDYEATRHDEYFTKHYFDDLRYEAPNLTSFISSTLNVIHFDLLMNAYRSMTKERQTYFMRQIHFEAVNFTEIAKKSQDRLIIERLAFVSFQSQQYSVDNYLDILRVNNINAKRFDVLATDGYLESADNFLNIHVQSPQKMEADNCTIGLVSVVGIQASWKYPFKSEQQFWRADGQFKFAHDLKLKIDILQIPFKGEQMILTMVIPRVQAYYMEAQRLFQMAHLGKFRVQIPTIYIPKFSYSVIIKDFSVDRYMAVKPYNLYRCMTQKMVLNVNEDGITTSIPRYPETPDVVSPDWIYEGKNYYPPLNSVRVDSPFFFTIHYVPTNDIIFLGKWRPSNGPYVEQTLFSSDDYF